MCAYQIITQICNISYAAINSFLTTIRSIINTCITWHGDSVSVILPASSVPLLSYSCMMKANNAPGGVNSAKQMAEGKPRMFGARCPVVSSCLTQLFPQDHSCALTSLLQPALPILARYQQSLPQQSLVSLPPSASFPLFVLSCSFGKKKKNLLW